MGFWVLGLNSLDGVYTGDSMRFRVQGLASSKGVMGQSIGDHYREY